MAGAGDADDSRGWPEHFDLCQHSVCVEITKIGRSVPCVIDLIDIQSGVLKLHNAFKRPVEIIVILSRFQTVSPGVVVLQINVASKIAVDLGSWNPVAASIEPFVMPADPVVEILLRY